jgi:hypothetical protein
MNQAHERQAGLHSAVQVMAHARHALFGRQPAQVQIHRQRLAWRRCSRLSIVRNGQIRRAGNALKFAQLHAHARATSLHVSLVSEDGAHLGQYP